MIFTDDFLNDIGEQFNYVIGNTDPKSVDLLNSALLNIEERELELANQNALELIKIIGEARTLGQMNAFIKSTYYGRDTKEMAKLIQYLSIIKNIKNTTEDNINTIEDQIEAIKDIYDNELLLTPDVKILLPKHQSVYNNVKSSFNNFEWYNTIKNIENIPTGLFKLDPFKEHKIDGLTIRQTYSNISTELRKIIF